jgi:hypothetical protein
VSSQGSSDSSLTQNSQASTVEWKYPNNTSGGRRLRKSRRNKPLIKTRKGRKGRRRRVTMRKGKKHYRTMKRNRMRK